MHKGLGTYAILYLPFKVIFVVQRRPEIGNNSSAVPAIYENPTLKIYYLLQSAMPPQPSSQVAKKETCSWHSSHVGGDAESD
jgi:hypothetical protein